MNMPGMQRFVPYLGAVVAFALFVLLVALAGQAPASAPATSLAPLATSTSDTAFEPIPLPELAPVVIQPPASSTPVQKSVPAIVAAPAPIPVAPSASEINATLDAAAVALRAALVNIICYAPSGGRLRSISGSGVFIDPKGFILTNAHIAQEYLLADRGVACTIRAGSPAVDRYEAALAYLPPAWIRANADILTKTSPIGTGEHDYALLAVTKSVGGSALPASFPFVPLATRPLPAHTPVVIASYGAQFLESSQIRSALSPIVVFGSVKEVFTFVTNTIDVLALGGSAAAQEGSSGGGVADASGELAGTITTSTTEGATDTRSLDAITASYIRADYASETGEALDLLLERDPTTVAADFASQIPALESILTAHLP